MSLLSAGDSAPDVGFSTADRQEINLVDFKGSQKVVLAFYGRAFTGGWERELRKFQSLFSEFQQFDTQVLGASSDAAPAQRAFAEHCELQFPLVADFPNFAAAKAFGVFNEERLSDSRVTFVIDKDGVIQHVIDDPRDFERHATESLEIIKNLP